MLCPDDRANLVEDGGEIRCTTCNRRFALLPGPILDLLPSNPVELPAASPAYMRDYLRLFNDALVLREAKAWGAPEGVPPEWAERRREQVRHVLHLLPQDSDLVVADFSAGAGYYTLPYAHRYHLVLHCDLSVDSLNYAAKSAAAQGLSNIVFIRMDYLRPPFAGTLDVALCFDSLIRGIEHDRALLAAIRSALTGNGVAVVDFHNWWHNPLRRLGILPQNFRDNRSYGAAEARALLRSAGVTKFECFPFSESRASWITTLLVQKLLPSTRLVYRFRADA